MPQSSRIQLPHQSTTDSVKTTHRDLIHDIAYDYYGKMLATCSGDQTIKIFKLIDNEWIEIQEIRQSESTNGHTHKSAIRHLCWAHPLFGSIIATVSVDKTINIFELCLNSMDDNISYNPTMRNNRNNNNMNNELSFEYKRVAYFTEAIDIISCEFSPHHLGLKLAIVLEDGIIKIMEARDITKLSTWMISQQIIIHRSIMPSFKELSFTNPLNGNNSFFNNKLDREQRKTLDTQLNQNTKIFCMSWNKSKWEFPTFCVGANNNRIFIYGYTNTNNTATHTKMENALSERAQSMNNIGNCMKTWNCIEKMEIKTRGRKFDVRGIDWANHMARKDHLIAAGCSDGFIRVIKITRNQNRFKKGDCIKSDTFKWNVMFENNIHTSAVWRVKWNITATNLLSAGDDGLVYLWKKNRIKNEYEPTKLNGDGIAYPQSDNHKQNRGSMDIEQKSAEHDNDNFIVGFGDNQNQNKNKNKNNFNSNSKSNPFNNNQCVDNNDNNIAPFSGFGNKESDKPEATATSFGSGTGSFGTSSSGFSGFGNDNGNLFGTSTNNNNNNTFGGFNNNGNANNGDSFGIGGNKEDKKQEQSTNNNTNTFATGFGAGSNNNDDKKQTDNNGFGGFNFDAGNNNNNTDSNPDKTPAFSWGNNDNNNNNVNSNGNGFNFGSWGNTSTVTNGTADTNGSTNNNGSGASVFSSSAFGNTTSWNWGGDKK